MTMIVTILTLVLLIGTGIIWKKGNGNGLEHQRKKDQEAPVEIPENDREWKIRTELIERIRVEIVHCLTTSGGCWINTEADGKNLLLNHGEAHALLMPFLQKGYFAYIGSNGSNACGLTRFGVVKHRLPHKNELEITQELLSTNAQL